METIERELNLLQNISESLTTGKSLALQAKKKKLVEEIVSSEKSFFKSLNGEDILHLFD